MLYFADLEALLESSKADIAKWTKEKASKQIELDNTTDVNEIARLNAEIQQLKSDISTSNSDVANYEADIKAKLKPKKSAISAEMLDTANTYDDKVALVRMIVGDEAGRVANVFKQMMRQDIDLLT